MALHQLFRIYASVTFQVVDVLGIVRQELSLLLKQMYELVCGSPVVEVGENIARKFVENTGARSVSAGACCDRHLRRIFVEVVNVEYLLRVLETHFTELRVKARVLRAEIGDAETS